MPFNNFYNYKIMLDMDGVICDFVAQWLRMTKTNMIPREFEEMYGLEEFYEELAKYGEKFWSTMPWTTDGLLLFNYVAKYRPTILTTPTLEESCRIGKEKWVRANLPIHTEMIFSDKKEEWADRHSILIDDKGSNVRKFIIAEGNGIEHISAVETIKILKKDFGL